MQTPRGTVHRQVHARDATNAIEDLLATRLMHRPVAEEPEVCPEQFRVLLEQRTKVRRSRLLFTIEKELEIDRRLHVRRAQCIERAEHFYDRGLVVARRTAV